MTVGGSGPSKRSVDSLADVVRNLYLAWRLFIDRRVSRWLKSIPLFSLAYAIWPFDLLADPILGLGQLDDLAVILLGIKLFISLCPPKLVDEHWQQVAAWPKIAARRSGNGTGGEIVDTTYRVLDDEE